MATVIERTETEVVTPRPSSTAPLLRRPKSTEGFWGWITTIDHKRIGILYGVTAFIFFLAGGIEALLVRTQLAQPDNHFLTADTYNQLFTMHGTTMIFLVVMPLSAAFFNYFTPIMIGAGDVAFPRLNSFSYWTFLLGGLVLYSSFLFGGAPNGGWFAYPPNTGIAFSPGHGLDYYVMGLIITGIASTVGAVNFITTILNLRAPGMTLMRMPIFVWMTLVANFLLLFALPVITIAVVLLFFDRNFGTNFFNPAAGGEPLLWQHLFWLFGHPEVYILILPAMGMVSEILPVFSRKPLFGYPVMVFSGIAIGFMGWGVWAHHMFSAGLGPVAVSAFSITTMFIAVPTGVKIFNWLGTMWGGSLRFTTAALFAIGFIAMFTIGGLSGVTHAVSPHDRQQTDTYYIVAHFHYVLFGGSLFGIMGAVYYWYPKIFGRMLNEKIGKWHFWTWIIGFNMTFGPMHFIGLQGQPRRTYTYPKALGLGTWNLIATIGAYIIAISVLIFIGNVIYTKLRGPLAPPDPWDARTLEWSIPSPPPPYNFEQVPVVHSVDDWWHRKYTEDENGRLVRIPEAEMAAAAERHAAEEHAADAAHSEPHMPSPSFYPLVASAGLPIIAYGLIYHVWLVPVVGLLVTLAGLYAWTLEPAVEPPSPDDEAPATRELVAASTPALGTGAGDAPAAADATATDDTSTTEEGA
ncbi:MAG TPA: cytochrome c oxidase subunit I [Acidimicrobiales bacterium]|nr:cytochrome c oxidase subunit I [Acidimicrobiales bacterium]